MKDFCFANAGTTILGLLLIPFAAWLLYSKEGFGSWDFMLIVFTSMVLIWFKESAARNFISTFSKKINPKQDVQR